MAATHDDVMDYIKKRWEQIEATVKRHGSDGFQIYRTGVEDGIELSKGAKPINEEMIADMAEEYSKGTYTDSETIKQAYDDYYNGAKAALNK